MIWCEWLEGMRKGSLGGVCKAPHGELDLERRGAFTSSWHPETNTDRGPQRPRESAEVGSNSVAAPKLGEVPEA